MQHKPDVIQAWIDVIATEGRGLSRWEEHFIETLTDQFERTGTISDRQEEILERIYSEKTP